MATLAISIPALRTRCSNCSLRELCLPVGLVPAALAALEAGVQALERRRKGTMLFRVADPFTALYAVRVGSFKTTILAESGREQVVGYHLPGDLLGLDGIGTERHGCSAIALEDSEVCPIPFANLEEIARTVPALQHNLCQFVAREISHDHGVMLLLGSRRADERLASFLVSLSARYFSRGYSSTEFTLRMTREEIGSYLGLSLETVSRLFSRFQVDGVLEVDGRNVRIRDMPALRLLAGRDA